MILYFYLIFGINIFISKITTVGDISKIKKSMATESIAHNYLEDLEAIKYL